MRTNGFHHGKYINRRTMVRLGLIVNPIAGMGGRVGLKGTDGEKILNKAITLGADKSSSNKALRALKVLKNLENEYIIFTASGEMGEDQCEMLSLNYKVIYETHGNTTGNDTKKLCIKLVEKGIDCLVFSGGDGTARDVLDSVGSEVPVIGIPAGVKIQSAVFALNPEAAGKLITGVISGNITYGNREVIDLNEDDYRENRISSSFYGYLNVPEEKSLLQNKKAPSPNSETLDRRILGREITKNMEKDALYLIGAGTTAKSVIMDLGITTGMLGIDAVVNGELIGTDLAEVEIEKLIRTNTKIVISPIGGQGFIFGRGNQQFSPEIIKKVGRENILVLATENKIKEMYGAPLRVDTGEENTDEYLKGYYRVITGFNKTLMYPVK